MRISPRLQCAAIALALLPCWAAAQSSLTVNTDNDPASVSADHNAAPATTDVAAPAGDVAGGAAVSAPTAALDADPFAPSASNPTTSTQPGEQPLTDQPVAQDGAGGPTASSATAGIAAHSESLTRQQVADRASDRYDRDHGGVGRDVALMVVGGAGMIAGLLIGGPAGVAVAVIGAAIGLTGLFLFLR
jgi:hypothetical protein